MEAFLQDSQHLKIRLEAIKSATGNFDDNNFIGKGRFGKVYEGVLSHFKGQSMVAFKRLDRRYGQGDPEFLKEILMLSYYTHENLISLLGFCDEDGEKILVYEHVFHGSLDRHLSSTTLTWRQRLKICVGAAKGLCYLHDPKETQQRVLHRDIKSSNILLDTNWNAKVSDMGLSKIGPANQKYTFLATNVVGTFGYLDPMYAEKSVLTKESDIYSFGIVLFEVLCGRLCFEYINGHMQSSIQMWRKSYKQKKLDEIIFQDMKDQMDPSSLETFSDIAYRCLQKSCEERPKMSLVEKLEIALRFQEISEEVEPPIDYKKIMKSVVPRLVYKSEEQLKMLLSKGILVDEGKTWFWLNKNGEHCEMISTTECLIPIHMVSVVLANYGQRKSRFPSGYYRPSCLEFKTHVRTQFLSPHITYTVNLVFSLGDTSNEYLGLTYLLDGETKPSTSYFADTREDGWLMAELYQFTSKSKNLDLEITFKCTNAIALEGIEFQPLERVEEHQVVEDEEVDMQTISDSNTYWEQKLPSDYEDIVKRSKDSLQWTTKKELYFILCKGFRMNMEDLQNSKTSAFTSLDSQWLSRAKLGKKSHLLPAREALQEDLYFILAKEFPMNMEDLQNSKTSAYTSLDHSQWFSLAKNGKKCHLLPAREALQEEEWEWQSLPESRFEEAAFGHRHGFRIHCRSDMLSCQTTYATYLVYKLQENNSTSCPPVKAHISLIYGYPLPPRYAYLVGPQTPILRSKDYQNTHNPLNRPKIEGLPQLRNDGWMEVQVWEFRNDTNGWYSENLRLTFFDKNLLKGIIVEGIEFKPI